MTVDELKAWAERNKFEIPTFQYTNSRGRWHGCALRFSIAEHKRRLELPVGGKKPESALIFLAEAITTIKEAK